MKAPRIRLFVYVSMFIAVMALGTVGSMIAENLAFGDAIYFTIATVATVGYGDIHPATPAGKILAIVLIVLGVGTFLGAIGNATEIMLSRHEQQSRMEKLNMVIGVFFSEVGNRLLALAGGFYLVELAFRTGRRFPKGDAQEPAAAPPTDA